MIQLEKRLELFPSPIRVYKTGTSDSFNEALVIAVRTGKFTRAPIINRTNLNSGADAELINTITEVFEQGFKAYVEELYKPEIYEAFNFYQDWSVNVHPGHRALVSHTHKECFLAMTYYPEDCENTEQDYLYAGFTPYKGGQLAFHTNRGNAAWDKFALFGRTHQNMSFTKGTLAVFPGDAPHFTVPGGEGEYRVCIASFVSAVTKTSNPLFKE